MAEFLDKTGLKYFWGKIKAKMPGPLQAYPVGSVYISISSTFNPNTSFGGTWERFGQGRTLIGEGTGNDGSTSMSFTAGSTGGEYKHDHVYGVKVNEYYGTIANLRVRKPDGSWQDGVKDGAENATFNSSCQGGKRSINTAMYKNESNTSSSSSMQPYITVYFWKRTA